MIVVNLDISYIILLYCCKKKEKKLYIELFRLERFSKFQKSYRDQNDGVFPLFRSILFDFLPYFLKHTWL